MTAAEQPWPDIERWPVGRPLLSVECSVWRHHSCTGRMNPIGNGGHLRVPCSCLCHDGAPIPAGRVMAARAIVLTDLARRDLAEMAAGGAS